MYVYMYIYDDTIINRIEMSEWDKSVKSLWYWIPRVRDDDVDGEVGGEGRCRKLIIIRMEYFNVKHRIYFTNKNRWRNNI